MFPCLFEVGLRGKQRKRSMGLGALMAENLFGDVGVSFFFSLCLVTLGLCEIKGSGILYDNVSLC